MRSDNTTRFLTVYTVPEVRNGGFVLTVQPCQDGVLFARDQPIRFDIRLTREGRPCSDGDLHAYFKWNSERVVWHHTVKLVQGRATIEFSCEQCGFGNLHVLYYRDGVEVLEQLRGIAISPERLRRSYPCPDDFDAFWAGKKAALRTVPMQATHTRIDRTSHPHLHASSHKSLLELDSSDVAIEDVQVACLGPNVSGILTRPLRRHPRSLPALLYLHGAGVRPCEPGRFVARAAAGAIIYEINAHGIPNDRPGEWYKAIEDGELLDYHERGRESRDTYYFLGMFLRVLRALEFLRSLPEWNGRTLVTMGGSQGAAQACAGAYLDRCVSAVVASSPAYGDLTGFLCGRTVNWPEWLHLAPRGRVPQGVLDVAPYFDTTNFLRNYRKDLCCCLGLLDQGCRPTTNYVPFSECPASSTVILQSDCYHRVSAEAEELLWAFVFEHSRTEKR